MALFRSRLLRAHEQALDEIDERSPGFVDDSYQLSAYLQDENQDQNDYEGDPVGRDGLYDR